MNFLRMLSTIKLGGMQGIFAIFNVFLLLKIDAGAIKHLDGAYAYDSEVRLAVIKFCLLYIPILSIIVGGFIWALPIKIKNRERKFLNRSMEIAIYF
jgi:hypothetical protein